MFLFSQDVDLAKFEPNVFGSWYLSSQVLCGGTNGIDRASFLSLVMRVNRKPIDVLASSQGVVDESVRLGTGKPFY